MKRTSDVLLKELNERSEQILDVSLPASSDSALSHLRLADSLYRHINTIRLSHLRLADTLCQGSYKQLKVRFKNIQWICVNAPLYRYISLSLTRVFHSRVTNYDLKPDPQKIYDPIIHPVYLRQIVHQHIPPSFFF